MRSRLFSPNASETFPWDMSKIRTWIPWPCPVRFLPTSSLRPLLLLPELPHPSLITSLKGACSLFRTLALPLLTSTPPLQFPPNNPQISDSKSRKPCLTPPDYTLTAPVTALPQTQQHWCDSLINIYVSHETKLQGGKDHVHFPNSYFLST